MVDPVAASRLGYRCLFLFFALTILFARLLPLGMAPPRLPGPDLLLALALVWLQRRPDHVPVLILTGVFLLEDLLTMRPPGLWPLIVLTGTEFLRSRETTMRDLPFLFEWLMASAVIMVMILTNWLVLALFIVPQAGFGPMILQALATIVAYPLVVAVTLFGIGLRRAAKGEIDALGHRL